MSWAFFVVALAVEQVVAQTGTPQCQESDLNFYTVGSKGCPDSVMFCVNGACSCGYSDALLKNDTGNCAFSVPTYIYLAFWILFSSFVSSQAVVAWHARRTQVCSMNWLLFFSCSHQSQGMAPGPNSILLRVAFGNITLGLMGISQGLRLLDVFIHSSSTLPILRIVSHEAVKLMALGQITTIANTLFGVYVEILSNDVEMGRIEFDTRKRAVWATRLIGLLTAVLGIVLSIKHRLGELSFILLPVACVLIWAWNRWTLVRLFLYKCNFTPDHRQLYHMHSIMAIVDKTSQTLMRHVAPLFLVSVAHVTVWLVGIAKEDNRILSVGVAITTAMLAASIAWMQVFWLRSVNNLTKHNAKCGCISTTTAFSTNLRSFTNPETHSSKAVFLMPTTARTHKPSEMNYPQSAQGTNTGCFKPELSTSLSHNYLPPLALPSSDSKYRLKIRAELMSPERSESDHSDGLKHILSPSFLSPHLHHNTQLDQILPPPIRHEYASTDLSPVRKTLGEAEILDQLPEEVFVRRNSEAAALDMTQEDLDILAFDQEFTDFEEDASMKDLLVVSLGNSVEELRLVCHAHNRTATHRTVALSRDVCLKSLKQALSKFRPQRLHVIIETEVLFTVPIRADLDSESEGVPLNMFARVLGNHAQHGLEMVFLSGPKSTSIAQIVKAVGIPSVICWDTRCDFNAKSMFAETFYEQLGSSTAPCTTSEQYRSVFWSAQKIFLDTRSGEGIALTSDEIQVSTTSPVYKFVDPESFDEAFDWGTFFGMGHSVRVRMKTPGSSLVILPWFLASGKTAEQIDIKFDEALEEYFGVDTDTQRVCAVGSLAAGVPKFL